jgi:Fic family protein
VLYETPLLTNELRTQLEELGELRQRLGREVGAAGLWLGTLRRLVQATSIESSTSIEGFSVPAAEAAAIVAGEERPNLNDESQLAVSCYARAMEHVGVMADDPGFHWYDRVILDLHFEACEFQRDKSPGRWRSDPIRVTAADGRTLYQAPDADKVPALMAEVADWLEHGDRAANVVVRAAMAHLHIVSVHPFRDGNGRISRIAQSLVLAREGLLTPEFASIEEYLGQHTPDYHRLLQEVQGGSYQPERDATPWIAFCVQAHVAQARRRLDQIDQAARRWSHLERLAADRGWPDRLVVALEQALIGGTDRARYGTEADISPATATNDLRRLLDAGLITQQGRGRNTHYHARRALNEEVAVHPNRLSTG